MSPCIRSLDLSNQPSQHLHSEYACVLSTLEVSGGASMSLFDDLIFTTPSTLITYTCRSLASTLCLPCQGTLFLLRHVHAKIVAHFAAKFMGLHDQIILKVQIQVQSFNISFHSLQLELL